MKKIYLLIAAVSFVLGLTAGIMLALIKISKKLEYELETLAANHDFEASDVEDLYAMDGYKGTVQE